MDMSPFGRPSSARGSPAARDAADADAHERWHDLLAQIGAETASPLTAALERINLLTSTGRIDRQSLRALRDEVEAARQAGMIGQQLTRFASGRLHQSPEPLPLDDVLRGVIAHRSRETAARGIEVTPLLKAAEVTVDASLLFGLLNTTLDWAQANARSAIEFAIDLRPWPVRARLTCRFAHRAVDDLADGPRASAPRGLDSLTWRLLEQTAWSMGLILERADSAQATTLTLEFPHTAAAAGRAAPATELDDGFAPSGNSQPLAGSHVLVIAAGRDLRVQVRDALRPMSLIIDFVNSVDEAAAFCREGLPHAVIVEAAQSGGPFAALREEIAAEVPGFVFIEIVDDGPVFEMSGFGGSGAMARVGRAVIANSLPSALMFELSKAL